MCVPRVTVHGAAGDCPVFRPKAQPFEYGLTENTGLSPSAADTGQPGTVPFFDQKLSHSSMA